jgi:hypothetical protein
MVHEWGGPPHLAAVPPGSIVLDNLTLQSAFRALSIPKNGRLPVETPELHIHHGRMGKWNYEINNDFRLSIDLACLGQLLQAILINENIAVDPKFMFRWGAHPQRVSPWKSKVVLPEIAKALEAVIVPLQHKESLHRERLLQAASEALRYASGNEFREYLHYLALHGVDGAVIEITNGYFGTGYCDPSSLSIFNLDDGQKDPFYRLAWGYEPPDSGGRLSEFAGTIRNIMELSIGRNFAIRKFFTDFLTQLEGASPSDHALARTPYAPTYGYEKAHGSAGITKHVAAALYTQKLASDVKASYMPHPLRNSFVLFDTATAALPGSDPVTRSAPDLRLRCIRMAEAIHRGRVAELADTLGLVAEDVNVPFALASVLRASDDPAVILDRAMEMRESKSGRRLRRWFTNLHEKAMTGDGKLDDLARDTRELDRQVATWLDSGPRNSPTETTSINMSLCLGVVSISATRNLRFSGRNALSRRQLRFLYDLTRIGNATPQMHRLIGSVFGPEVGKSWLRAQKVMTPFRASSAAEHHGLLDLR